MKDCKLLRGFHGGIAAIVMKTNFMNYLSLIYFVNQPPHVLGMFIAHHQEVFTVYVQQLVSVKRLGDWQLALNM
jgi:hypothetical protein